MGNRNNLPQNPNLQLTKTPTEKTPTITSLHFHHDITFTEKTLRRHFFIVKRKIIWGIGIAIVLFLMVGWGHAWIQLWNYEHFISEARQFKNGPQYFPDSLPESATRKRFFHVADGYALKFRLPEKEAQQLKKHLLDTYIAAKSDRHVPDGLNVGKSKQLSWRYWGGNHGASDGIWFNTNLKEFTFYHGQW